MPFCMEIVQGGLLWSAIAMRIAKASILKHANLSNIRLVYAQSTTVNFR